VYCLGDSSYGLGGFLYGGTSTEWLPQYGQSPTPKPSMVAFDNSVDVMNALGCQTIRAEIQPNDPTTDNGTSQRAQLFSDDTKQAKHGLPSFGATRGQTWYYGFAFSTNQSYRAQDAWNWPDWNNIFIWHGTAGASFCGIAVAVSTKENLNGMGYAPFADGQPHLSLDVWGNSSANPSKIQEWHLYDPNPFQAGHRYRISMKVLWGDSNTGGVQWWVDGAQASSWTTGVSDMSVGYGLYPIFENYRPANAQMNNMVTWTNTVFYAGLVKGSSLADVSIP
jgi:hypothetical protein